MWTVTYWVRPALPTAAIAPKVVAVPDKVELLLAATLLAATLTEAVAVRCCATSLPIAQDGHHLCDA